MTQHSLTTRLGEYISLVLPDAHGHQRKAMTDFVLAVVMVQSCCQAGIARFFDNFEAASKRLSRLIHNARLEPEELARSHARALVARLPAEGCVRLALDWTIEDMQHLLVASLSTGRRAVPLYWRAYHEADLKARMSIYEREFVRALFDEVLCGVARRRFVVTADRWFADVNLLDVLNELGVSYVIRTKSNYKVRIEGRWRRLDALKWTTNQRRRAWGRVWYGEGDPRHVFLVQARARNKQGRWGIWHLLSNRNLSTWGMTNEYARRFTCEEGFRDAKRLLGFAEARIRDLAAWARMFTLVAIALAVLTNIGSALAEDARCGQWLRQVLSRRQTRSELSIVCAVVALLTRDESLWQLLDYDNRLNLEAIL
ncbi:MAG: transposase [Acidobacteriota bacterium]|nr:transposase [Acidobacteriota bacterium]